MAPPETALPEKPIDRVIAPVDRFMHVEASSGVVLLLAALAAFALANSPLAEAYAAFWNTSLSFGIGGVVLDHSLKHWVSDGLMAIFFFVVGLEVKRELVIGELRDMRRAALPLAAALGGMIVPAAVYLALAGGGEAARGWGIPMATDIAFVVGCIALLGPRAPLGLRVLLLSLAIADDIGAILVIAIGYTASIDLFALALGGLGILAVVALARAGVRSTLVYVVLGTFVWLDFHESGVHATIAGVLLGLLTPVRAWVSDDRLDQVIQRAGEVWRGDRPTGSARRRMLGAVETASREAISPLERLEHTNHPWSAFVIMPIFALANAGVSVEGGMLAEPVALAVGAGLVIGKPVGILLFCLAAVKLGLAELPEGVGWTTLTGGAFLAGIGFTMSLFIAGLALEGTILEGAKVGILLASLVAGVLGMALLMMSLPRTTE
jgi:NhaA family Na+:H+ antiporter